MAFHKEGMCYHKPVGEVLSPSINICMKIIFCSVVN